MLKKDLTGKKYGRLTAIRCTEEKNSGGNYIWEFLCDCGNIVERPSGNIVSGHTTSCGCSLKDAPKTRKDYHGMKHTSEYKSWCKIKERCYNPKSYEFARYGAKGIFMDEDFKNDFRAFIEYIGLKPSDGLRYSVDRIDNSLGYVRGNIRWATYTQQARNKTFQQNNTSGKSGVRWDNKRHPFPNEHKYTLYATAQWVDIDGKFRKKNFSVKKYGLLEAFAMACAHRENMIALLNKQGAGYSANHGKKL